MKLEDACTVFIDGDWIESKDQSNIGIRLIQTGNIGIGEYLEKDNKAKYVSEDTFENLKCTEVFPGDILISRLPEPVGRACIIPYKDERMITAVDCTICRPNEEKVLKEYLCYFMQSTAYYNQLVNSLAGTTRKRISRKNLGKIEIRIPNKSIQTKVITNLDLVTKLIRLKKEELSIYNDLVKSRFIEIFGDPVINDKGWPKDKLKNHADVIVGYPFASSQYTADGLPIVGGYNLMQGFVQWENSKFWPSPEGYEQYLLKDKDIVIAMDRPWVGSGFKIAIIEKADLPAILIQRTACIRCKDIPTQFLYRLLDSAWFADHCQITGSLVPHISNKDILNYEIIVPPLDLQNQFADFVALTDKSKLAVQQSIETLQMLKAKLMQDYFG
ncbi:restriction endonuclease subunit S [Selenomonas ruminantium]|uniref:restriction endonuclease subunit S n=1 Tax=Selenomonas ruminantium TaxID=971 RepID=UPI0026F29B84|nr:restriction endonuclease subunit S [Selenomonas ruminantium]